jgi:hypothetical protein
MLSYKSQPLVPFFSGICVPPLVSTQHKLFLYKDLEKIRGHACSVEKPKYDCAGRGDGRQETLQKPQISPISQKFLDRINGMDRIF